MHNIIRLSFLSQSGCLCVNGVNIKDQPLRYNPFNCSGSKRRLRWFIQNNIQDERHVTTFPRHIHNGAISDNFEWK